MYEFLTGVNFSSFEEQNIEDLDLSPNSTDLNDSKVHLLENYFHAEPSTINSDIDKIEITSQQELPEESLQISKHIILLLCLLFSMCIVSIVLLSLTVACYDVKGGIH